MMDLEQLADLLARFADPRSPTAREIAAQRHSTVWALVQGLVWFNNEYKEEDFGVDNVWRFMFLGRSSSIFCQSRPSLG